MSWDGFGARLAAVKAKHPPGVGPLADNSAGAQKHLGLRAGAPCRGDTG